MNTVSNSPGLLLSFFNIKSGFYQIIMNIFKIKLNGGKYGFNKLVILEC